MWVVKHTSGKFLHIQYVTHVHRRSFVELVDNRYPCFKTEDLAKAYITDGKDAYYSYDQIKINIADLTAIELAEKQK